MTNYNEKIGYPEQKGVRRLKGSTSCRKCGHPGFETRDCAHYRLMYRYPNMFNNAFWAPEFADAPHFISSLPHSRAALAGLGSVPGQLQDSQHGDQLIFVARTEGVSCRG